MHLLAHLCNLHSGHMHVHHSLSVCLDLNKNHWIILLMLRGGVGYGISYNETNSYIYLR